MVKKSGSCGNTGAALAVLGIDPLMEHNFSGSGPDVIRLLNPSELVVGFQFFGDALRGFHLVDDRLHPFLGLLVQVGKVCPKGSIQNPICIQNRTMRLQVIPVHSPLHTDGTGLNRQLPVGDEIISHGDMANPVCVHFLLPPNNSR